MSTLYSPVQPQNKTLLISQRVLCSVCNIECYDNHIRGICSSCFIKNECNKANYNFACSSCKYEFKTKFELFNTYCVLCYLKHKK